MIKKIGIFGLGIFLLAAPVIAQESTTLPPALRAAVQSGNADAVSQAIATLSGGNSVQSAQLAAAVVHAAEQMLSINPKAAIAVGTAALKSVTSLQVQNAAPTQTQDVITTAARLFTSPAALQTVPEQSAALATAALNAVKASGNNTLIATIAQQAVSTAEKILNANPSAAVQLAGAAVQSVKFQPVESAAPAKVLDVATIAARVIISPQAILNNAQAVGQIATDVTSLVTNKSVYQSNPTAAIAAMGEAYNVASNKSVIAAFPTGVTNITTQLNQASGSNDLNKVNPTNSGDIAIILAGKYVAKPLEQPQTNTVTAPLPPTENQKNQASPS
jgi:hypothetical protein